MSEIDWCQKWLLKAEDDIISARHLFETIYPKQIEICCYLCQQSAEKFLKGYLVKQRLEVPRTHDLILLCNTCLRINEDFSTLLDDCADLSPYAIQTRYPNEIELEENDAVIALKKADRIRNFVLEICRCK